MTVREIVHSLLLEYEASGKYVNLSLSSHRLDGLSPEERGIVASVLYTVVERRITYDYYIATYAKRPTEKIDSYTLAALRLGVCQIVTMEKIPDFAAVNETVKLGRNKGERAFINGVLRAVVRAKDADELPLPPKEKIARHLSVKHSFPQPLVKHFIDLVGIDGCEKLLEYYNESKVTDLTVNTTKISREALLRAFVERGIDAVAHPDSSLTIRLAGSYDPRRLFGFDEGYFLVQDAASAISALALGTERGDRVIDVCAAPGGKSFAAAILSGETGSVLSQDLHESKLSLIRSGKERLGLSNIEVLSGDATDPRVELFGTFDRVICDCPCSGLGVLAKKADMRYRSLEEIEALPELQYSILSASANYLKVGGTLLYSTCTLNPKENEEVASRFLREHPDFVAVDFKVGSLVSTSGMLTTYPHIHKMDGFFISKMVKVK